MDNNPQWTAHGCSSHITLMDCSWDVMMQYGQYDPTAHMDKDTEMNAYVQRMQLANVVLPKQTSLTEDSDNDTINRRLETSDASISAADDGDYLLCACFLSDLTTDVTSRLLCQWNFVTSESVERW
ncbi:hypothetical protein CDAR_611891 [Caerostris darwini]|uniref:Uncharacterized protein n=1 Tax=Caerostris darwini TaxID=1538125 RepID=A0AAV4MU36_9ARAC|nr:hypothetical protein CDAR_611891 [Caerostris darwini]